MLWIALHLPWLSLEACDLSGHPEQPAGRSVPARAGPPYPVAAPMAVVNARHVLAVNRAAQAMGLRPGQTRAMALSLAPQVQLKPHDPLREQACVQTLALALARLSPHCVPQDDGVLIEVAASMRLFGGARTLCRQARDIARACGHQARWGMAATPLAADWLARSRMRQRRAVSLARTRRLLARLPVAVMIALPGRQGASPARVQPSPRPAGQLGTLRQLGCHHLADLRALPREGLQRRFGTGLMQALDQAWGTQPDPRVPLALSPRFEQTLELMHRADTAEQLLFAVRRLLPALAGWLSAQWLAAQALALTLHHERSRRTATGAAQTRLDIALAEPTRDADHLLAVLRERLPGTVLREPVHMLTLRVQATVSDPGHHESWLPDPTRQRSDHARLLDRLQARLGPQQVQRLVALPDYRAEAASAGAPASPAIPRPPALQRNGSPLPAPAFPPGSPRPVWLLPQPVSLRMQGHCPVDPWQGQPLTLLEGPERLECGWFDGHLIKRDYHVAEDTSHRRLWVYQERPGHDDAHASGWFLHGLFG